MSYFYSILLWYEFGMNLVYFWNFKLNSSPLVYKKAKCMSDYILN